MIKLKKSIVAIIFFTVFFSQLPAQAQSITYLFLQQDSECKIVVTNYLNAINQYNSILQAMIPLSDDNDVTRALTNTQTGIANRNITYNAMQVYTGAITSALKKHPNSLLDTGEEQLLSQLASMHTRVEAWKDGKDSCRDKHGCLLGQPGYCDKSDGGSIFAE